MEAKATTIYQHLISDRTHFHTLPQPLPLESGEHLFEVRVAYRTWGRLNANRDNAIVICHALTGNADADTWWEPLFGEGRTFDPDSHFIICSNVLGSCYGTTGATDIDPLTGKPYAATFPQITVRDMVRVQAQLLEFLGVESIESVIGGSLGGMQVLEWGVMYPDRVRSLAVIAASGRHSAWCIGLSEAQRQAIYTDPHWCDGLYTRDRSPRQGLATARMMAMSTYRSHQSFALRFERSPAQPNNLEIVNYLHYHGDKFIDRFDANTYIRLTQAMDSHDLGWQRGAYTAVLEKISIPALIVAIDSDILYPPSEQQELANFMPRAEFQWLRSHHGHDAFLIDMEQLNDLILRSEIRSKLI